MHTFRCRTPEIPKPHRHGFALVIVLVCVALLALSVCLFSELSVGEAEVITTRVQLVQSRLVAESLLEQGAALVEAAHETPTLLTRLPQASGEVSWQAGGLFHRGELLSSSLTADNSRDRWGLDDESSRLHLGRIPLKVEEQATARAMLQQLPGVTIPIADAILDWLDDDNIPREFGAEASYYQSRQLSTPRNGLPPHVGELILVRGVTQALLYGDKARRQSVGLHRLLTVSSANSTLQSNGRPKIDVNQDDLVDLYDRLALKFGDPTAQFIVAFRLAGPTIGAAALRVSPNSRDAQRAANERAQQQQSESSNPRKSESMQRGGLNLSLNPAYRIRTLFDLCGTSVRISIDGRDALLKSPWSGDAAAWQLGYRRLSPWITTTAAPCIAGLVSVNTAPKGVLQAIPGLTPDLARAITSRQERIRTSSPGEYSAHWSDLTWLMREGVVNERQFRDLAPWLTTQGSVFRSRATGQIDGLARPVTLTAVLDGCSRPTVIRHIVPELESPTVVTESVRNARAGR